MCLRLQLARARRVGRGDPPPPQGGRRARLCKGVREKEERKKKRGHACVAVFKHHTKPTHPPTPPKTYPPTSPHLHLRAELRAAAHSLVDGCCKHMLCWLLWQIKKTNDLCAISINLHRTVVNGREKYWRGVLVLLKCGFWERGCVGLCCLLIFFYDVADTISRKKRWKWWNAKFKFKIEQNTSKHFHEQTLNCDKKKARGKLIQKMLQKENFARAHRNEASLNISRLFL